MKKLVPAVLAFVVLWFVSGPSGADQASRRAEVEQILGISQQVIPNPRFLESPEWRDFVEYIQTPEMLSLPREDFRAAFNRATEELPFTHYRLVRRTSDDSGADEESLVEVSGAGEQTAVLRISVFEQDTRAMQEAIETIATGPYENLVIDLRPTMGGTFTSVMALGRFLTRDPVEGGVHLTRQWFAENGGYPTAEQRAAIEVPSELNLEAFHRTLEREGAVKMSVPGHSGPIFEGDVYVLTSGQTASAAEGLVYAMKRHGGAPIVGERTAGALLSAERFPIGNHWVLMAPVADFVTADGTRIDQVGIEPDVEVPADQALDRVLQMIRENG